jgi:hypothetical protein
MKKVIVKTKSEIEDLAKLSALTWEGLSIDDENLEAVFDWLKQYTEMKNEVVYIISGKLMNESYDLKNKKRYPDDLHIVSVKLSDMETPSAIVLKRFDVGGRWMDDIINNF